MNKITNLPKNERPREKAVLHGFDTLSDAEVLAIIISSGTKESSAIDLANEVLGKFGGLYNTIKQNYEEFLKFKGIKQSKATKLRAVFEIARRFNTLRASYKEENIPISAEFLYRKHVNNLAELDHEVFMLIVLSNKRKITFERVVFEGSINHVTFSTRDILKMVILHNGRFFYVIHNHPSGDVRPSNEDIDLTTELSFVSESVGISLLDHLIIGKNSYYSFSNQMVIEESSENKS